MGVVNANVDVAVVGAGPAGAWTACLLARRGARVLLFDPSHPREKACGGGITARALALVAEAIDLRTLPAVRIRSARFTAASTPAAADVSLNDRALVVASRAGFDGVLFDAARRAGAVILPARVTRVRALAGRFEIESAAGTHRAAVVAGADGANSLVRRTFASAFRRDQLSLATGFFAHGVSSRDIAIEFVSDPPGYIWSFPRPDHLAIGICAQADVARNAIGLRDAATAWIRRTGIAEGARLERYSWPIPSLSATDFDALSPAGSGWYLLGDAAGLVDPITREGIYFALLSAQWAADAILSGGAAAPLSYTRRVREEIGTDLARAARAKPLFFQPRFSRLLIDALQHSAGVRAAMSDLVAGQQDYAGLKWRLVKTLRPGLAARLTFTAARILREATASPSRP